MSNSKKIISLNKLLDEKNAKYMVLLTGILYWCYGLMPFFDKIFNLVIIFCVFCYSRVIFYRRSMPVTIVVSLLIGLSGLITFLWNTSQTVTIFAVVYMVIATGLMTYCSPYKSDTELKAELNRIAHVFFVLGIVIITISLVLYFLNVSVDYKYEDVTTTFLHLGRSRNTNALVGVLSNANIASDFCVIFFGLLLYLSRSFPQKKVLYLIWTIPCLIMLFFTYSRGGYIGIIVLICVMLLLDLKCQAKQTGYRVFVIIIIIASVVSIFYLLLSDAFIQIINGFSFTGRQSIEMENSTAVRFLMWQTGWRLLRSNPIYFLFGVGSTIRDKIGEFAPSIIPRQIYNNMHNVYIQVLVSFGCIGLFLMLRQIIFLFRGTFRWINKEIRLFWDIIPIIALEVCLLVINVVESDIYMKKSFEGMTFWILLGFIYSIAHARIREKE